MRQPHWVSVEQTLSELFNFSEKALNLLRPLPSWEVMHILEEALSNHSKVQKLHPDTQASLVRAFAFYKVFELQGTKIYKLASDFGWALRKADCKVSMSYIPFDNEVRCIEFPDDMALDMGDGDFAHNCYVGVFAPREGVDYVAKDEIYKKRIELTAPLYGADGVEKGQDNIRIFIKDDDTIESAVERSLAQCERRSGFMRETIEFILKCVLYINSGDPDLRHLKPTPKPPADAKRKHHRRWARENECPVPVTLLGFGYKKPREFSKDTAFVNTHMRWQPYGPNRSKIKLIWVKEHERQLKKGESSTRILL